MRTCNCHGGPNCCRNGMLFSWHGVIPPPPYYARHDYWQIPASMFPAPGWECPRCKKVHAPHVAGCDCAPAQEEEDKPCPAT